MGVASGPLGPPETSRREASSLCGLLKTTQEENRAQNLDSHSQHFFHSEAKDNPDRDSKH